MICKYFLAFGFLCVLGLLQADRKICKKLKPCGDRGVCDHSNGNSKSVLTIKCFCRHNYTGQWCQYVDDQYQPGPKGEVPRKPHILTDTKIPSYETKYHLQFKAVPDPPKGKVLYYILRYLDVNSSQGQWRSETVAVKETTQTYKVTLDKLDWGRRYRLELFAGNRFGLGKPAKRIVRRPKVSVPKIVNVSKDLTGANGNKPFKLHCKATGIPQPSYSWLLEGRPVHPTSAVQMNGETLTISKPHPLRHEGEYRCVASNVWGSVLSRPIQVQLSPPGRLRRYKPGKFSHTSLPDQILYQNTDLTMNCGTKRERNYITWFYNGKVLRNSRRHHAHTIGIIPVDGGVGIPFKLHRDGQLQLDNTKPSATGIYQCDVITDDTLVTMTQYVHVRDFDHVEPLSLKHKTSDKIRLRKGGTATLTCVPPSSNVFPVKWENLPANTWKRSRRFPNGSLEIRNAGQSESNSRVTCRFSSDQGVSGKRSIRIHVVDSVNGGWSSWGSWQSCPKKEKTCSRVRLRKCNNPTPRNDGKYCPGFNSEAIGVWSSWTSWACVPVSGNCGEHVNVRHRTCNGRCHGKARETKSCSRVIPCPVDGVWLQWSSWSACTKTCHPGGRRSRSRACTPPKHGGKPCIGQVEVVQSCNSQPCPVDGSWLQWSSWSACSKTCHPGGARSRSRACTPPKHGGKPCIGNMEVVLSCNTQPCPVHGGWSSWSSWSHCSSTCNAAERSQVRTCTNPAPSYGGKGCQGDATLMEKCNNPRCKVDGGWSAWSDYSACTVSCGTGITYTTRVCDNPKAEHGGKECVGDSQFRTQCDMPPCKVDGGWSTWSPWSECSFTCGIGVMSRIRNCSNPEPKHGGQECKGENKDETACEMMACPVDGSWSTWTPWSECSVTCGIGVMSRIRSCSNPEPKHGGQECMGEESDETACKIMACPVNGGWSSWGEWTACSASCDSGVKNRTRSCTKPKPRHGGEMCHGERTFVGKCHLKSCRGIDVNWAIRRLGSRISSAGAMILTIVGGLVGLVLLGMLFCVYRWCHLRSKVKDYTPLGKIRTQPSEPESILKQTRRANQTPSDPGAAAVGGEIGPQCGGLPPSPPPPPRVPRSTRGSRRQGDRTKPSNPEDTVDKTSLERFENAILEPDDNQSDVKEYNTTY